jgi:Arc/MetJ family transcription regulator
VVRTNIDLDMDLIARASQYSASRSKRGLIHEALATFVAVKEEERRSASYRERLARVREHASGVRLKSDTRDLVRKDRDSR